MDLYKYHKNENILTIIKETSKIVQKFILDKFSNPKSK